MVAELAFWDCRKCISNLFLFFNTPVCCDLHKAKGE